MATRFVTIESHPSQTLYRFGSSAILAALAARSDNDITTHSMQKPRSESKLENAPSRRKGGMASVLVPLFIPAVAAVRGSADHRCRERAAIPADFLEGVRSVGTVKIYDRQRLRGGAPAGEISGSCIES